MNERTRFYVLTILGILIVALFTFGITYAYLGPVVGSGAKTNVSISSACANISLLDNKNSINLDNAYPMSDNMGLNTTPYTFKVTKTCEGNVDFRLYFVSISGNTLDDSVIKYAITNKGTKDVLIRGKLNAASDGESDFTTTEINELKISLNITDYSAIYKVYSATITDNNVLEYDLYLWVDKSVDDTTTMNKTFAMGVAIKTGDSFEYKDPYIYATLANNKISTFNATVNCEGSNNASWNPLTRSLDIFDLEDTPTRCTVSDKTNTNVGNLRTIVEANATDETQDGAGYRYEGENPNNYVWFNNELWRIIGSIPTKVDAQGTNENLVKIIRKDSIGGLVWHTSTPRPEWSASTLYTLLNSYYYGSSNATNTEYCYGYQTTAKAKCDYRTIGLSSDVNDYYGSMIKNVYWNTGAANPGNPVGTVYTAEKTVQNHQGYVGIMNASDYGYATNYGRTSLSSYNNANYTGSNWLYGNGIEWTLTPFSHNTNSALDVNSDGYVSGSYVYYGYAIRPVVYLDTSLYIVSGDGTEANPYKLGK